MFQINELAVGKRRKSLQDLDLRDAVLVAHDEIGAEEVIEGIYRLFNDRVKNLTLEKIFQIIIPKICSYYRLYIEDSPIVRGELVPFKRQDIVPSSPLLDQHFAFLTSTPAVWIVPAGLFAITLRFNKPLLEFANLIFGLLSNILQSVIGKNCLPNYGYEQTYNLDCS